MKNVYIKPLIGISCLIIIGIIIYFSGLGNYISLQNLKENQHYLRGLVDRNYIQSIIIYILLYGVIIATSLPLVAPLAIGGGYLYGALPGAIYSDIGATLGATTAFLLLRNFLKEAIRQKYHGKYSRLQERLKEGGVSYLLMLQFLSVIPFFIINIVAVLGNISAGTFMVTTMIGSFPFIFIYTLAGNELRNIGSIKDIFSPTIILLIVLLIAIAFLPLIIKRIKGKNGKGLLV